MWRGSPGADAVYPGYGFLSENPELAAACERAGIAFIGPSAVVLEMTGNKVRAVAAATSRRACRCCAPARPPTTSRNWSARPSGSASRVFAKAVAGGGGRGMRRVERREELPEALAAAMREAQGAFGDPTMFLEQAVVRPRHIEVQVLADAAGRWCTCSSGTARCSAGTRRWSRSPRHPTWNRLCGNGSAPTRWRLPDRSATSTPAPSSSCSTPRGRTPDGTCSSR